eukprot:CAMPEP_0114288968 /NCGR_PEP_ID=MMETSP0059-20121206/7108_1 /TAXON_ID=36894 /ORGANISM="Pyramimonas parkeae, Strain CCMP726" /LENGTH=139 /DNA_ID=CAMNT_0001410179 /DNA_START=198 /DNA_END=615 /DNA_ORIENTATION=-
MIKLGLSNLSILPLWRMGESFVIGLSGRVWWFLGKTFHNKVHNSTRNVSMWVRDPKHAHAREDVRWNTPMTTLICNEQPLEGDGRHIFKSEQLDPDRELTLNAHTCRRGCPRDDDFFQQQRTYSLVDASPDMDDDSAMW